jgi:hypothetical protein
MHLLDLNRLAVLSRDLQASAAELNELRRSLQSGGAALDWRSPAARTFQGALHELLSRLLHAGRRLAELASALARHRDRAAGRAAELAAAAKRGWALGLAAAPITAGAERLLRLP